MTGQGHGGLGAVLCVSAWQRAWCWAKCDACQCCHQYTFKRCVIEPCMRRMDRRTSYRGKQCPDLLGCDCPQETGHHPLFGAGLGYRLPQIWPQFSLPVSPSSALVPAAGLAPALPLPAGHLSRKPRMVQSQQRLLQWDVTTVRSFYRPIPGPGQACRPHLLHPHSSPTTQGQLTERQRQQEGATARASGQ